jgi:hypothetical protein
MYSWRVTLPTLLAGFAFATTVPAPAQMTTKPLTPSQMVAPSILVQRIDANCAVFQQTLTSTTPTEVASIKGNTWQVVDAAHRTSVEHTHSSITYAQAWKQAGNLQWVRWATFSASGAERATQLCFRSDGTLARARQAGTLPDLDKTVAARQAYFNTDGSVIKRDSLFVVNDPTLYKRVRDLPFSALVK